MKYVFCYDITDPKRLVRVSKYLEQKGFRFQRSFFIVDIDDNEMVIVVEEILKLIDKKVDSFSVYPICEKCFKKGLYLGKNPIQSLTSNFLIL